MSRIFALISLFLLSACSEDPSNDVINFSGSTMGTQYHVTLIKKSTHPQYSPTEIKQSIEALLLKVNQKMSTYITDSEISKFNQYNQTDWFPVSIDLAFVVKHAAKISKKTQGAFDITIAPLIDLWGFGAKTVNHIPSSSQLENVNKYTGYSLLNVKLKPPSIQKLDPRLRIDLSAIAKGFAVDKVSLYLTSIGFRDHLVEIGGEIRGSGKNQKNKPWSIAIVHPNSTSLTIKHSINLSNKALATSGNYNNYFIKEGKRYSHTIDPTTAQPITHKLASATVMADSTMLADAYATAIMVMGEIKGREFAKQQKLKVNLIYKENNNFEVWRNIE